MRDIGAFFYCAQNSTNNTHITTQTKNKAMKVRLTSDSICNSYLENKYKAINLLRLHE
ncbi:hypothetical protein EDC19_2120 [Natranaerovirga hydrolytica]|uniref:Uncharacterized protein n=1 Tax=Natranaerovirga hydrolytica TaxID=680378 RepID=A0A4R1MJ19_9FIRM|nr:hypothetical protein EDC19_2120 [Natranaerovirga hydrolytica]